MLKKVLGIGVVVLLVGALVGGTAYILLRSEADHQTEAHAGQGGERGVGTGAGGPNEEAGGRGGGSEGTGGSRGRGGREAEPTALDPEWQTVTGVVVSIEEGLTLETAAGEVEVRLGPAWYRESQECPFQLGDLIRVTGRREDETLNAVTVENLSTGRILALRDEAGRPFWAGGSRGGHR